MSKLLACDHLHQTVYSCSTLLASTDGFASCPKYAACAMRCLSHCSSGIATQEASAPSGLLSAVDPPSGRGQRLEVPRLRISFPCKYSFGSSIPLIEPRRGAAGLTHCGCINQQGGGDVRGEPTVSRRATSTGVPTT